MAENEPTLHGLSLLKQSRSAQVQNTLTQESDRRRLTKQSAARDAQIKESAVAEYKAQRLSLQNLEGRAAAHGALNELLKCSSSLRENICWMCHSRPASPDTRNRVCTTCASSSQI